jgi:hypothetical protein
MGEKDLTEREVLRWVIVTSAFVIGGIWVLIEIVQRGI